MNTDCRGTACRRPRVRGWSSPTLQRGLIWQLIHPNHPLRALQILHERFQSFFPDHHTFPYALCIEDIDHPVDPRQSPRTMPRAGEVQDSDLAILPSNSQKPVVLGRAPYDEEESVIRTSAPEAKVDRFWQARHRQQWSSALLEDADDCFGGEREPSLSEEGSETSEAEYLTNDSSFQNPIRVEIEVTPVYVSMSLPLNYHLIAS